MKVGQLRIKIGSSATHNTSRIESFSALRAPLLRQWALITLFSATFFLSACGGAASSPSLTSSPTVSATLSDLQRVFDEYMRGTFKVRYRVRFSAHMSNSPTDLGFVTQEKETTARKRFKASGDVSRLGMDDVIVLVDADSVYFCSSRLKVAETRTEPGCYTGSTARESAQLFVSGVGLPLGLTQSLGTNDLTLRQAWDTSVAGMRGLCFEYGSAKLPTAPPVQDCFSDDGILLSRRFTEGDKVTEIEAVDVGLPMTSDFAIPYPVKE